jgi:hypothetical protein
MKTKYTLLLLVLAAGLYAFIHFVERKKPSTREAEESGKYVAQFDADKINELIIRDREKTIRFKKTDKRWDIVEPIQDRADLSLVNGILTTFEFLPKEQTLELPGDRDAAKEELKKYGLTSEKLKLELVGEGAPKPLVFGNDTAVEGKVYAQLEGADFVAIVGNSLRDQINKEPNDFRDRRLTDANTDDVTKVVKEKDAWRMERPLKARADSSAVGNLINQVVNARIETFVSDDKSNLGNYGLSEPRGSITLAIKGRDKDAVLEVGKAGENDNSGKVYARFTPRESVYLLPLEVENLINTKPNDLRDRKLVRLDDDVIDRVTIEREGKGSVVLVRDKEEWKVRAPDQEERKANKNEVNVTLSRLRNETVREFVSDTASELQKYGLDKPAAKITFSSYASENVPEGGAGEHPLTTILLGKSEDGITYAKLEDEPFVVSVDEGLFKEIDKDGAQWRDQTVFSYRQDQVTRFSVEKEEGKKWSAEKGEDGTWKLTAGAGELDQTPVQTLLNTLAPLRAVRWVGAAQPEHGMEKPRLAISFTADGKEEKLTVGGVDPEGNFYATAGGEVFLLSTPEFSALNARITKEAEPEPSPETSPTP